MKKIVIKLLLFAGILTLRAADVMIYGERTLFAEQLAARLKQQGMTVDVARHGDFSGSRLVILPPETPYSDEISAKLRLYQGALMVMGQKIPAASSAEKLLVDWRTGSFRLRGDKNGSCTQEKNGFIQVRNSYFRDGSIYLEMKDIALAPGSDCLKFQVSGGADSDLLSIAVTARNGRQFVSYVPLTGRMKTAVLRYADFLALPPDAVPWEEFSSRERPPEPWLSDDRLVPEEISSVAIGLSRRHMWWDKGGSFLIGPVYCGKSGSASHSRSGYARRFEIPYATIGVTVPDTAFDPADGAVEKKGKDFLISAVPENPVDHGALNPFSVKGFRTVPAPVKIYGREANDRVFVPVIREKAERRIPLLLDCSGEAAGMVILPADTQSAVRPKAIFGLPGSAYLQNTGLMDFVGKTARYLLRSPQIRMVMPCLREGKMTVRVRVHHPGENNLEGTVTLHVGKLPPVSRNIPLLPGKTREIQLTLPEIQEAFDLTAFDWRVELQTSAGNDVWQDRADVRRSAEFLAEHLLQLAGTHADGRFSHHFFADVYGARAMAVLGRPEWRLAARRMIHGIVTRQTPEGAFPMGYGEQKKISWVADNGTAALAIVDFARMFPDLRKEYLASAKRFYAWRETFYIDDARVEKLKKEFGKDPAHIRKGFYGIGYNDGPFYGKGAKFDIVRRIERGSAWVNGISMASLPLCWKLTGDAAVLSLARRNLQEYLAGRPQINFFSGEALIHMYCYLPDAESRALAEKALREKFIPGLWAGKNDYVLLDKGGRRSLDTLIALYCRNNGLENTPQMRAYLLRNIWFACSSTLPWSVHRVGGYFDHSTHGSSIAAARYAGSMSLIWLAELLSPGATLQNIH